MPHPVLGVAASARGATNPVSRDVASAASRAPALASDNVAMPPDPPVPVLSEPPAPPTPLDAPVVAVTVVAVAALEALVEVADPVEPAKPVPLPDGVPLGPVPSLVPEQPTMVPTSATGPRTASRREENMGTSYLAADRPTKSS